MAQTIHQFTPTIPAATAKDSLYSVQLALPQEQVILVDLEVPPGPGGLMGFYLAVSGQQIIPFEVGEFIVWDDRFDTWNLEEFPTTGAWSFVGYNLDTANDHTVTVRFHDDPLTTPSSSAPAVTIVNGAGAGNLVTL